MTCPMVLVIRCCFVLRSSDVSDGTGNQMLFRFTVVYQITSKRPSDS